MNTVLNTLTMVMMIAIIAVIVFVIKKLLCCIKLD